MPVRWWECDHKGIGLPGCPTCDARLDPEARTALRAARAEIARLVADVAGLERLRDEQHRRLAGGE